MSAAVGVCPVCGREVPLLSDGRIGRHGSTTKGEWPPLNCLGWGQQPKAETER